MNADPFALAIREFTAATDDYPRLLDLVVRRFAELLDGACALRFIGPDDEWLEHLGAIYHPDPEVAPAVLELVRTRRQRVDDGVMGRIRASGQPVLITHMSPAALAPLVEARFRPLIERLAIHSLMAVPLRLEGRVIGVAAVLRSAPAPPCTDEDVRRFEEFAAHASLAIANARLFADRERELAERNRMADRLRLLSELTKEFLGATSDPHELLQLVARRVADVVGEVCSIRMRSSDREYLAPVGATHDPDPERCALAVVLREHDRIIGELTVYRRTAERPYTDDDRRLVEDIATHASLAISNSRLLEASRHELAERMRTEEVVRRGFLEAAPDAALIIDAGGKILLVNSQTEIMFGYARAELVGEPVEVLLPMAMGRDLFARRKDGSEFVAEVSLSPIETPDGRLLAATVRDVTERRRELEERNRKTEQANRLKSEFLANMSHELRTPLNAIIGFSALMHAGKAGPISDLHKEFLGDILSSSGHLLQLINDILDLAKVESGRTEIRPEPVDLAVVAGEVRDALRGLADEKRLRLEVEIGVDVAIVDPRVVKQVLYNLLSNAIKFTPDGRQIALRIAPAGDELRFDVEDNGIGIRPEDLNRLFVEFQQLDASTTKRYPGTGLGLALVRRLVEAHGGRVEVTSTFGVGSTFSAILPRVTMARPPA